MKIVEKRVRYKLEIEGKMVDQAVSFKFLRINFTSNKNLIL